MKSRFNGENILNPYFSGNSFATREGIMVTDITEESQSLF